jgi:hypothetical protein
VERQIADETCGAVNVLKNNKSAWSVRDGKLEFSDVGVAADFNKRLTAIQPSPRKKRKIDDISALTEYSDELGQATQSVSVLEHVYVLFNIMPVISRSRATHKATILTYSRPSPNGLRKYKQ